jgi:superfamily II DNA or RNA helicase
MQQFVEKPITLGDLRWGLKGNTDLMDKLECIKYYKSVKKIDKLKEKIKKLVTDENERRKLLSINDIDELKTAIAKWNETNCMNIILKLKRDGLIKIYKDILGYSNADLEELRGKAPKTSSLTAVQVVAGRKSKTYTDKEQKEFLENKGLDDIIDFDTFKNKLMKKDKDELTLTEPQKQLIRKFAVGNEVGLIAIWGLGTGKTTLGALSTMIYLQIYPDSKVIFISPASLLVNFVKTLDNYNVNIRDNRIQFYSYESYIRKKANCENALVIIDEAHNLRTPSQFSMLETDANKEEDKQKLKYKVGKRGGDIRRFCLNKARKILLLTGTPMVNTPYDIQTLMAMINQLPLSTIMDNKSFYELLNNNNQIKDYFSCKLSIFFNPIGKTPAVKNKDEPFPDKKEDFLYSYFPPEYEKAYDILLRSADLSLALEQIEEHLGKQKTDRLKKLLEPKKNQRDDDDDDDGGEGNPKAFFNGVRRLVNLTDDLKVKSIIDNILEWNEDNKKKSRNVIYTGFIDSGVKLLQNQLTKANLTSSVVMGGMGMKQKAEAVEKYNKGDLDVLLITKSGAEGLDLKNTTNLYLLDGLWNEALAQQIIGRGVRYKSHWTLPLEDRVVNIYRVFMIKRSEEHFAERVKKAKGNDFESIFMLIKEAEFYKNSGKEGVFLNPQRKDRIKKQKEKLKEQLEKKEITKKEYNEGMSILGNENEIWKGISNENNFDSKEKLIEHYFKVDDIKKIEIPTIDLRMFILSKNKQALIDNFFIDSLNNKEIVETIESNYCMTANEKEYEKQITQLMNSEEFKKKNIPEDEWKDIRIKIYSRIINKNLKELNINFDKFKDKVAKVKRPFIAGGDIVTELIETSTINRNKNEILRILVPLATDGAILKYLFNKYSDKHRLFLRTTEENKTLRDYLKQEVLRKDKDILYDEPNFLKLQISDAFDYIYLLPPLEKIKEGTNKGKNDLDFIKKAFTYLKPNGELVSLVSTALVKTKPKRKQLEKELGNPITFDIEASESYDTFYTGSSKEEIPFSFIFIKKNVELISRPIDETKTLIENLPELQNIDLEKDLEDYKKNWRGWLGIPAYQVAIWDYILEKHKNDCSPIVTKYLLNSKILMNMSNRKRKEIGSGDNVIIYDLSDKMTDFIVFSKDGFSAQAIIYFDDGVAVIKYAMKICSKRFIPLPINLPVHMNMAIIDLKNKTIERFEPHGGFFYSKENYLTMNKRIDTRMNKLAKELDLKYIPAHETCPQDFKGIQPFENVITKTFVDIPQEYKDKLYITDIPQGGLCAFWSFLYLDLRLTFPNLSPQQITDKVVPDDAYGYKEKQFMTKLAKMSLTYQKKALQMEKPIMNFLKNPILESDNEPLKRFLKSVEKYLETTKINPQLFFLFLSDFFFPRTTIPDEKIKLPKDIDLETQPVDLKGLPNPDKITYSDVFKAISRHLTTLYMNNLAKS